MKKSGPLVGIAVAALLAMPTVCGAGEEYMPLAPGAFSPVEFGPDGTQMRRVSSADPGVGADDQKRQPLRKNIIRLTLPSLGKKADSKMRIVDASPDGPDGTLRFKPSESLPGTRHADIPGLVPPELLVVSRMERDRAATRKRAGNFTPVTLPSALGTEELGEFDPFSVQRTGNPFKDAPGKAEAFPAAATRSQIWESQPLGDKTSRTRKAGNGISRVPGAGESQEVGPLRASELSRTKPARSVPASAPEPRRSAMTARPAAHPAQPPLPELQVRAGSARSNQTRMAGGVTLPPPLPAVAHATGAGAPPARASSQLSITSSGLMLPLPPMAGGDAADSSRPGLAVGPSLRPGEKIIAPQSPVSGPTHSQQMAQALTAPGGERDFARPAHSESVPALRSDDFTPMRGMRVY